jgi:hypothetical protein
LVASLFKLPMKTLSWRAIASGAIHKFQGQW